MDENRLASFVNRFVSCYKPGEKENLYLVKATLFGKPEIAVNGIAIPEADWKTKKNKGILEYLLLNRGRTVSKGALLDIFWPDSDSKSAMVSLRTALYQLGKTLAKYNVQVTDNNAFIYETLGGLQIKISDMLELDLHEFLRLNEELKVLKKNTPTCENTLKTNAKQVEKLERIVSLYRGVLLDGSDYGDLVFLEREKCKVILENACLKLGMIYVERGEPEQAEEILRRALTMEPYSENICRELLRLFMRQGMRSKAINFYYRFKKRFEQELGIVMDWKLRDSK
jgi:DNA-binding SARP family transcriptional activator